MVMVLMFLFSMTMGKESDPLNTLAAAAFVILMINPTSLFDISFQLSFSSVLAILYMLHNTSLFAHVTANQSPTLFSRFIPFLLVSLIAIFHEKACQ
jgi:competence protein ComEC